MKQIINGLTYNTETADMICEIGSRDFSRSDFNFWDAKLYRTKKGRFFMAGEGGARSPFARPYCQNGWQGGSGIVPLDHDEARTYAERQTDAETIERFFETEEA